ncbi:MAG: sulfatase [Kiritimatiellales bacterium]|jgi:arylsulfatase A-like enzyme
MKYKQRDFIKMAGFSAAALGFPMPGKGAAPAKPNIVFILADDLGWSDIGCYGATFHETPNLDRLAQQGMKFTDAYAACAVCSPTRASIMTGKYPARLHLTDWLPGVPDSPKQKLNRPVIQQFLPLEEYTVAEALKAGGYRTGFFGKWHLGESPEVWPEQQGFDVNAGGCGKGHPPSYFSPYKIPALPDGPQGEYLNDRLTDEAIKFIEQAKDKPFFLYLPHYAVHMPLQAKAETVAKYRAKAAKLPADRTVYKDDLGRPVRQVQDDPVYAAMMESLDENIGRIMDKLSALGLDKNTIIIFTSDNGGFSTGRGTPSCNLPLRMGKGWPYEGGVREPLIVRWPGVTAPGSVSSVPVISTDFYPTLLQIAGLPLLPEQHRDGESIVPVLKGGTPPERPLFWHYPHYHGSGSMPNGAVRLGDFKLIEWYEDMRTELYNVKADIGEHTDLAAEMPGKTAELRQLLHGWREAVNAQMPVPNPKYNPPGNHSNRKTTNRKSLSCI